MLAVVDTRVCGACQSVSDVLIGRYGKDGPTGDPEFDKDLELCPFCGSKETQPWGRHRLAQSAAKE
jgi:hypothetical protein